ncbi:MAG: hypothetical protein V3V11_07945, partial [Vicinamibacteria bacterium]
AAQPTDRAKTAQNSRNMLRDAMVRCHELSTLWVYNGSHQPGWEVGSVAMEENDAHDTHVRQFTDHYRRIFARTLQICNLVPQEKWEWRPAETIH